MLMKCIKNQTRKLNILQPLPEGSKTMEMSQSLAESFSKLRLQGGLAKRSGRQILWYYICELS